MKKILALFSTLLIFAGVKAQTSPTTPAVKKETVKPGTIQPVVANDTAKKIAMKENSKAIKFDYIKKTTPAQMKESPAQMKDAPVAKPQKH